MCTVALAPRAFRVRVWAIMSRARAQGRGGRRQRVLVLAILLHLDAGHPRSPRFSMVRVKRFLSPDTAMPAMPWSPNDAPHCTGRGAATS